MPIENAQFISELVPSNPEGTDLRSTSDDHHRLIKQVLKNTCNFDEAITRTAAQINAMYGPDNPPPSVSDPGVPTVQLFTTPGGATWTKPAGCIWIKVECQGGGGGGAWNGTAGGGGGYCEALLDVSAIANASITVGAAGAAGINGDEVGKSGGDSVYDDTINQLTASGGSGGPSSGQTGGAGGGATGGSLNAPGQAAHDRYGGGSYRGHGGPEGSSGAGAADGIRGGGGGSTGANVNGGAGGVGFIKITEYYTLGG